MKMVNGARFGGAYQADLFSLKPCAACGTNFARPTHPYCNKCHAAYMREWRKTHPLTPEQRVKSNARSYAGSYKRRGKIIPQPCSVHGCNSPAQMHHDDYSRPLDVEWMCRPHHLAHHREMNNADRAGP